MAVYEYKKETVDKRKEEQKEELKQKFNFHEDDFEQFGQDLSVKELIDEMENLEEQEEQNREVDHLEKKKLAFKEVCKSLALMIQSLDSTGPCLEKRFASLNAILSDFSTHSSEEFETSLLSYVKRTYLEDHPYTFKKVQDYYHNSLTLTLVKK